MTVLQPFPFSNPSMRCHRINKIKLVSQNGITIKCSLDDTTSMNSSVTKRHLFSCIAASLVVAALPNQVHAAESGKAMNFDDKPNESSGMMMTMMMKGMTANNFDPIRYSGRWFEVASLKKGFAGQGQEDCHCTQGIYTFDSTKSLIQVDTFCVHGGPDGYITGIRGNVQCLSEDETVKSETDLERQEKIRGKCYLRFPTLPFIPKEPYDVIATDYDNFALVSGAKDMSFVQQIYSRTPNPGPAFLEKYKSYLANYGYDPSKIRDTPQDCPEMSNSELGVMMSQSGLFQLAIGIVSGEDEPNWSWFLTQLKLMISDDERNFTFITDRHPGLIIAIQQIFPDSHHGYCLYHLSNNLKSYIKDTAASKRDWILTLFTRVAYATNIHDFNDALNQFKHVGGEAANHLLNGIPFEKFATMFFKGNRYGEMASNCSESFNSWIKDERSLPITTYLDKIRIKIMKFMSDRRELSSQWQTMLCLKMELLLNELTLVGIVWEVTRSSEFVFEVHSPNAQSVDLSKRRCSCNVWAYEGFPCAHAIRCMRGFGFNVYDFVEDYFKVSVYRKFYSHPIHPVINPEPCAIVQPEPFILPPKSRRRPGRPSACNRIKSIGEMVKRKTKCSL